MAQRNHAVLPFQNEKLDLSEVMEEALNILGSFADNDQLKIRKRYDPNIPRISLQKIKVVHLIMNLLRNAKEAMMDLPVHKRLLTIQLDKDETWVFMKISDTGKGIAKQNLEKIFTQGYTTKSSSLGFGLHGCANAMTEMKGRLSVQSEGETKGATFTLQFPRDP